MKKSKSFQLEVDKRQIEACSDIRAVKDVAIQLLKSKYHLQAMVERYMRKELGIPEDMPVKR